MKRELQWKAGTCGTNDLYYMRETFEPAKLAPIRNQFAPISNQFSFLKLDKVFTLEVSKIMHLAKQNKLPSCLQSYFAQTSEIHTYGNQSSQTKFVLCYPI